MRPQTAVHRAVSVMTYAMTIRSNPRPYGSADPERCTVNGIPSNFSTPPGSGLERHEHQSGLRSNSLFEHYTADEGADVAKASSSVCDRQPGKNGKTMKKT